MSKQKKILVITHSNNDFDHFLPLLVSYNEDTSKKIVPLAFYHKNDLLKNKLHRNICRQNKIQLRSFTDLFRFRLLSDFNTKIYVYSYNNAKEVNYTGSLGKKVKDRILNFFHSPKDSIIRVMYYISKKYIVLYSLFFLTKKQLKQFFSNHQFQLAIIDIRAEEKEDLQLKPLNKLLKIMKGEMKADDDIMFRFLEVAREQKIPILAIPHGPTYLMEDPVDIAYDSYKELFRADYTFHCNDLSLIRDKMRVGLKKSLILGDPRYDVYWIDYIESIANKLYRKKVSKPTDKTIVLYIASFIQRHTYYDNIDYDYHNQIHKDILSLVNYFPNIEVWMKYHPRRVYKIPIEKYINPDRITHIRFFGNETDTSILLDLADIVISPMSTTLAIPILRKKPVIYYSRWKEKTGKITVTTIFDECPFLIKAANHTELKEQLAETLRNKKVTISDSDVAFFYKKMFSVDSPHENMTEKYIDEINNILEMKL